MKMKETHSHQGLIAALLAVAFVGFAPAATAQQQPQRAPAPSFGGSAAPGSSYVAQGAPTTRGGMMPLNATSHFQDSSSGKTFLLERKVDGFLFKWDSDPEVFFLRATSGQRGDTFLRSDDGRLVLRVTELGNLISYFGSNEGVPADRFASNAGMVSGLAASAPPMTASLTALSEQAKKSLSRSAGQTVTVFGASRFANNEAWVGDALNVVVKGVEGAEPAMRKTLKSVELKPTTLPSTTFSEGELVLGLNPQAGVQGRPSSSIITSTINRGGN
jgi:hypothetical protein